MYKDDHSELLINLFRRSTLKTSDNKKVEILNKWIDCCSKEEEFLLACYLKSELDSIEKNLRVYKKRNKINFKFIEILKKFLKYE